MSASSSLQPLLLPPPVGETPPSTEARRPAPRHRGSPKYRLFFVSRSNNRGGLALRGGVASIAAEESLQQQTTFSKAGTVSSTGTAAASTATARRIAIRRSTMEHNNSDANVAVTTPAVVPTNVVQWLQYACPSEILPKVLSFCGPQKSWTLMKTNRFWYHLITNDATWKVVCEENYKWKEGDSIPTTSWREYYRLNPCVPVDYATVHKALMVACQPPDTTAAHLRAPAMHFPQRQSLRIFLRPGKHYLKESIVVHSAREVQLSIETMEMPSNLYHHIGPLLSTASSRTGSSNRQVPESATLTRSGSRRQMLQRAASFHQLVWQGCRTNHAVEAMEEDDDVEIMESHSQEESVATTTAPQRQPHDPPPTRATLIMRTRRHNEPILRVRQGHLKVLNVDLHHTSHGIDIWNGNAAVQVQPPMVSDELPMAVDPRPSIELEGVEVVSRSGRGIVNIDGGHCIIRNCYIHDCAATGIYVGGPGSQAHIERTDVVQNGNGNRTSRRGIGRGHSGIYLEQGHALIRDCNISRNSLTGVSAISPENAFLSLEGSDLVANGTFQLEMPNLGSLSRRRSITRDNHLAIVGLARSRSGLVMEEPQQQQYAS